MQSLPVVIIRCEENEIYQLDFRIQTDNIRCFILLSGLRNLKNDEFKGKQTHEIKNKQKSFKIEMCILNMKTIFIFNRFLSSALNYWSSTTSIQNLPTVISNFRNTEGCNSMS